MTFVVDRFGNVVFHSNQNVSSEEALSGAMKKKEVKKEEKRQEKPQPKK